MSYLTYVSKLVWLSSQGDMKMGEFVERACQYVFTPFCTSDIYDPYMDGCGLKSATYISNPNSIIIHHWFYTSGESSNRVCESV